MKKLFLCLFLCALSNAEDIGTQSIQDNAVTHDKLYSGVEKYQDTTLTNAQILAMSTTPITIVTAPATGYANILTGAALWVTAGTTAVALQGSFISIRYTNASGSKVVSDFPAAATESTSNTWYWNPAISVTPVSVAAIVIHDSASVGQSISTTSGVSYKLRAFYRSLKVNPLSSY